MSGVSTKMDLEKRNDHDHLLLSRKHIKEEIEIEIIDFPEEERRGNKGG